MVGQRRRRRPTSRRAWRRRCLQAAFVGFALYWTIANWWADLIQSRRRARIFTIVVIGLNIIGSSLFLRVVIAQNSLANYYAHLALGA